MTHKQKVLALLRDGKPHTHMELYRLGCVAHSRVSDLRKDGYTIEQWRDGDMYLYRLVGPLDESGVGRNHGFALSSPDSSSGPISEPSALTDRRAVAAQPPLGEAASEVEPLELVQPSLFAFPRGAYDEAAA